jgi:hypothetical protein
MLLYFNAFVILYNKKETLSKYEHKRSFIDTHFDTHKPINYISNTI